MSSVFYNSNYGLTYDDNMFMQAAAVGATSVTAYIDSNNQKQNLILGASSNVVIEAYENVKIYYSTSNNFTLYNTSVSNSIRTDRELLDISGLSDTTYIHTSDQVLDISGRDAYYTTIVGKTTLTASNNLQFVNTSQQDGFAFSTQMSFNSNIIVANDIVGNDNLTLGGNVFSSTLNLYKNKEATELNNYQRQIAYGFYINEYDQLEFVKYNKYGTSNLTSTISKVATFGFGPHDGVANPSNYTNLDSFNGFVTHSNGVSSGISDMLWSANSDKMRIYYNASNVGINKQSPQHWLDVDGDICTSSNVYVMNRLGVGKTDPTHALDIIGDSKFAGDLLPAADSIYNLGSADLRWKTLYINANTIDMGAASIGVNSATGNIEFKTEAGDKISGVENIYTVGSNIGIGNAAPIYSLDVTGTLNVSGNIYNGGELLVAFSSNTAVSASNKAISASNTAFGISNIVSNASNIANEAYVIASVASNVAYNISSIVSTASNIASESYVIASLASNVAYNVSGIVSSASNIAYGASEDATLSLNMSIENSNIFNNAYSTVLYASNLAVYGSNTAVYASNLSYNAYNNAVFSSNLVISTSNHAFSSLTSSSNLSDLTNIATARNNLGFGSTCNVSFSNYTVSGDIIPTQNSIQSIGTSNYHFNEAWIDTIHISANTLYLGDTAVLGTTDDTINIRADADQSINIKTTGTGSTFLTSVKGVELSTSGLNSQVLVQSTGEGGKVVFGATNLIEFTSPSTIINGPLVVSGNFTVNGSSTIVNAQTVEVKDNIILLNSGQVGSGVTAGQSGLRIDRGDYADYMIVFDESDDQLKMGEIGQLQTVASTLYVNSNPNAVFSSNAANFSSNLAKSWQTSGSNFYVMSNFGIGKTNPAYPLDIVGDLNFTGTLRKGGAPYIGSQWSNNSMNVFILDSNVGIHKSNPSTALDVNGTITATEMKFTSDDRLKENKRYITNAVDIISKLKPQIYDKYYSLPPRTNDSNYIIESGFIAQEVFYDVPELRHLISIPHDALVSSSNSDYSAWGTTSATLNYVGLIPYLTEGIKEINTIVNDKDIRITVLETENNTFNSVLNNMISDVITLQIAMSNANLL
jgi:hypothetical protein